jgi:hypothetical protein
MALAPMKLCRKLFAAGYSQVTLVTLNRKADWQSNTGVNKELCIEIKAICTLSIT